MTLQTLLHTAAELLALAMFGAMVMAWLIVGAAA